MTAQKKEHKPLNAVALLFFMIIAAAILTYVIPAGTYQRVIENGRQVVNPHSFQFIQAPHINLYDIFLAIPNGLIGGATVIFFVALVGGGMGLITRSGALNIGIARLIDRLGPTRGGLILIFLYAIFTLMGGFLGLIEGAIPFMPLAISIAVGLGYDTIVGVAIAIVGGIAGFAAGPTNPFTVAIAQNIAGLPIYSGIGLRLIMFLIIPVVGLLYVMGYAKRVKENPAKSLVASVDQSGLAFDASEFEGRVFTVKHALVLLSLVLGIIIYVYGSMNWKWNLVNLAAIFVIIGIIAGLCSGLGVNETTEEFIKGVSSMTSACMVMGIAYSVSWMLTKGKIMDTIIYYLSQPLNGLPQQVTVIGILIVIMLINLVIPSGSGKALIVMPIVLPIAQIVGIESQVAILAYQFGDALTNLCTPLLGVLMLALGFGRVPFGKWERFILPLVLIFFALAVIFLMIAMVIGYH